MSKEIYCPECKHTFVDEGGGTAASDEESHIASHAKCWSCKKAWQHGELDWQIRARELLNESDYLYDIACDMAREELAGLI